MSEDKRTTSFTPSQMVIISLVVAIWITVVIGLGAIWFEVRFQGVSTEQNINESAQEVMRYLK